MLVQLTNYQQADRIFVIVYSEGGETVKEVWQTPSSGDVGTTRLLVNEPEEDFDRPATEVVDIGEDGQQPYSYCKNEQATFNFYAESDGQRTLLEQITI